MSDRTSRNSFHNSPSQLFVYSCLACLIGVFICWYVFYFLFFYPSFTIGIEGVLLSMLACLGHVCLEAYCVSAWFPFWLEKKSISRVHLSFSFIIGVLFTMLIGTAKSCLSLGSICGLLAYFIIQEFFLVIVAIREGEPFFRRLFFPCGRLDFVSDSSNLEKDSFCSDTGKVNGFKQSTLFTAEERQEGEGGNFCDRKYIQQCVEYLEDGTFSIRGQIPIVFQENEETTFYNVIFLVPFEKKPTFEYEVDPENIEVKINSAQPYGVRLEVTLIDSKHSPNEISTLEYYAF